MLNATEIRPQALLMVRILCSHYCEKLRGLMLDSVPAASMPWHAWTPSSRAYLSWYGCTMLPFVLMINPSLPWVVSSATTQRPWRQSGTKTHLCMARAGRWSLFGLNSIWTSCCDARLQCTRRWGQRCRDLVRIAAPKALHALCPRYKNKSPAWG